jgi:Dynamin family
MRSFDELRSAILALFDVAETLAVSAGAGAETLRRLRLARERLESGLLTTVVCGEFKRGKSTLLSALLNEPGLFPADALPGTNVVTSVRWGEQEAITATVRLPDSSEERVAITRAEIAGYVTEGGNPRNKREVITVEIEIPNSKLESGQVFIDTPGTGGVFTEHTAVTQLILPAADALLFVTDVEAPLYASELDFLRRAIHAASLTEDADSLVSVLTKIDQGTEYEEIYDETVIELARLTGRPEQEVVLIPVSSVEKLRFLADGDQTALENSNFAALEEALWAALGRRRVRVLLGGGLRALRELGNELLAPLAAALTGLRDKTGAKLDNLQHESEHRNNELAELASNGVTWQRQLNAELKTAQERLDLLARNELEKNWTRFLTEYVHDERLLNDLDLLRSQADADMTSLLGVLLTLVRREVAAAMERFSAAHRFSLTPPRISDLPDLPPPELAGDLSALRRGKDDGGWAVARGASIGLALGGTGGGAAGALAGATLGAFLGTFLFPGVGTAAGAALGASLGSSAGGLAGGGFGVFRGYKTGKKAASARTAESLRNELIRVFNSQKTAQASYLSGLVKQAIDEARPAVISELKSRLAQQQETVEKTLQRLNEARRAAQEGQDEAEAQFAAEREPIDALITGCDSLGQDADLLSGATGSGTETGRSA